MAQLTRKMSRWSSSSGGSQNCQKAPSGAILDDFEAANPGIKVVTISGPYLTTKDQIIASAATGTMADVVGLDGAWVNVLWKQGALHSLTQAMADAEYDDSELAAQIRLAGETYMIPIANFIYPVFVNLDMLAAAGIDPPLDTGGICGRRHRADRPRQQCLGLGAATVAGAAKRHPE